MEHGGMMVRSPLKRCILVAAALFATAGCGGSYNVNVPNVQVEHHLRLDEIEVYFRNYCEARQNPQQVEKCVAEHLGEFLAVFR